MHRATKVVDKCPAKNCKDPSCQGHYFPPLENGLDIYRHGHIDGSICGFRTADGDIEGGLKAFMKNNKTFDIPT